MALSTKYTEKKCAKNNHCLHFSHFVKSKSTPHGPYMIDPQQHYHSITICCHCGKKVYGQASTMVNKAYLREDEDG